MQNYKWRTYSSSIGFGIQWKTVFGAKDIFTVKIYLLLLVAVHMTQNSLDVDYGRTVGAEVFFYVSLVVCCYIM